MLGAVARQGPGPRTAAYRLALLACSASHRTGFTALGTAPSSRLDGPSPDALGGRKVTLQRPYSTKVKQNQEFKKGSGNGKANASPGSKAAKAKAGSTSESKPHQKPSATHKGKAPIPPKNISSKEVFDYPLLLPAPDSLRLYKEPLGKLSKVVADENLAEALALFQHISDWRSLDKLHDMHWQSLSKLILQKFRGAEGTRAFKAMYKKPEQYGVLTSMAVDAAIRDHWEGLFQLLLACINAGDPLSVTAMFKRYKSGLITYQGKNVEDLYSWNRAKRMAARVVAEGFKPLATVNLAALAMLDKVDTPNILLMFNSTTNWSTMDRETLDEIQKALGRGPQTETLRRKFADAVDKFQFAILCYHPNALKERILALTTSRQWEAFDSLYTKLLKWSVGSDRLFHASDLGSSNEALRNENEINLPPSIWLSIIIALKAQNRAADIYRLVDYEFGRRNLVPSPFILARTMVALGQIYTNKLSPQDVKETAHHGLSQLSGYIKNRGLDTHDQIISGRLELALLLQDLNTIYAHYEKNAKFPTNIGPAVRSTMVRSLLRLNEVDMAVKVLSWTFGDKEKVKPLDRKPYTYFIRTSVLHLRSDKALGAINKALRVKPDEIGLLSESSIMVAIAVMSRGGEKNIETGLELMLNPKGSKAGSPRYEMLWTHALGLVLYRWDMARHTTLQDARIGLLILQKRQQRSIAGSTEVRAKRLWALYWKHVAKSQKISPADRRDLLEESIAMYNRYYPNPFRPLRLFPIIESTMSRRYYKKEAHPGAPAAAEDQEAHEALYWWMRMRGQPAYFDRRRTSPSPGESSPEASRIITAKDHCNFDIGEKVFAGEIKMSETSWLTMFWTLRNAGRNDRAIDLIAEAWNNRKVPLRSNFWDEVESTGLLLKANITLEMLESARKEEKRMKSRSFKESLVKDKDEGDSLDDIEEDLAGVQEGVEEDTPDEDDHEEENE